ncbi:MAG: STAS domain-containing protein [Gammaproteobacteria bacterium]|nr:MAG: STAS domain-containing protein [Gammaproteobacteria bacterium]
MAGAGTTGATMIAVRSGGRRYAGSFAGLTFALLVWLFGPVGSLVPICVLAGIILHVAVHMVERDILAWLRRSRTRTDALIALLVTSVTVAYDLMAAVGLGVGIAVLLFVAEQVRSPVIHRRTTAADRHSVRVRPGEHYELLERHGEDIVIYELRGSLFFATADKLFEQVSPDLDRCQWMILNLRRVSQVDLSALRILRQMADRLEAHGGMLLFTNVHKEMGTSRKVQKSLRKISPGRPVVNVLTFSDTDEALEYAEDALLEGLGARLPEPERPLPLEQTELCRDMTPEQVAALAAECRQLGLKQGENLFRVGDEGNALYVVTLGEVDILLPTGKHHHKRLAKCGPGSFFGEISLLEPGPRAATAQVVRDASLLEFDRAALEELAQRQPAAAVALLETLGRSLGKDLRWSARELRRLAQW